LSGVVRPNSPDTLRIALISSTVLMTPPDSYGGLERIVADLGTALAKMGHDVTVFAADGSSVPGCKVVEFGEPSPQADWRKAERDAYEVYKDTLDDFDIVHGHDWFCLEYAAKMENPNLKVLHTHHGQELHFLPPRGSLTSRLLRLLTRQRPDNLDWWARRNGSAFKLNFVAVSNFMRSMYSMHKLEAKVVYNGLNLEKYLFKASKGDRLIFIGRIDRWKQPHVAIQVAKRLNVGLDVVGVPVTQDQEYFERIERMVDGTQIVFYRGESFPHEHKVELLGNAKACIFPSKTGEAFGLVPIEAMACGTPVIATNDGAVQEVVGRGGVVCETYKETFRRRGGHVALEIVPVRNEADAIAEALNKLDIRPEDCRANADLFSSERMAEAYLQLYRDILEGKEW